MKNLVLLLSLIIAFTSCKLYVPMGTPPPPDPAPYVKLRDGSTIDAKKVIIKNNKILADGTGYKRKSIISFSNGKHIYQCVKKKSFATLIYTGDINVYQTVSTNTTTSHSYGGGFAPGATTTHTHTIVIDYVQKPGTDKLMQLNFKSVNSLIKRRDPGYVYLETFKSKRTVARITGWGGFVLFIAGGAILGNSVTTNKGGALGGTMMVAGVGGIVTGYTMGALNFSNLKRAIAKHNGVKIRE